MKIGEKLLLVLILAGFLGYSGCWNTASKSASRDAQTDAALSENKVPQDAEQLAESINQPQEGLLQDSRELR